MCTPKIPPKIGVSTIRIQRLLRDLVILHKPYHPHSEMLTSAIPGWLHRPAPTHTIFRKTAVPITPMGKIRSTTNPPSELYGSRPRSVNRYINFQQDRNSCERATESASLRNMRLPKQAVVSPEASELGSCTCSYASRVSLTIRATSPQPIWFSHVHQL